MPKKKDDMSEFDQIMAKMAKAKDHTDDVRKTMAKLHLVTHLKNNYRPDRAMNFLHMSIGDTEVVLTSVKTGKKVGSVISNMGGSVTIHDTERDEEWTLSAQDLWGAYANARNELGELPPLPKGQAKAIPAPEKIKTGRLKA